MATDAIPKGTLVRPTPDFYIDQLAIVGGGFTLSSANDVTFDLYNNTQPAAYFHVYKIWVFNDGEGSNAMSIQVGHGANFVTNAFPIVFDAGSPAGQLYQDQAAQVVPSLTIYPTAAPYGSYFVGGDEAAAQHPLGAAGPIAVIPPGYSLRIRSLNSIGNTNNSLGVTFYYAILNWRR
jgi:hypothetical protein